MIPGKGTQPSLHNCVSTSLRRSRYPDVMFRQTTLFGVALLLLVAGCGDSDETSDSFGQTQDGGAGAAGSDGGSAGTSGSAGGAGAAGSAGDAGGPSCPPLASSALQFDGVDDDADMGVAPALGLSVFTIEAWVRRDGAGMSAGTGVGGVSLVPIAGKGRGEDDGSTVDCNYAFGFWGDVLGADFEDMESGLNHPVKGKTVVPWGEWHHVAATYDGQAWRLYLDGKLDGEAVADAVPRADSIQHFGIGSAFDSKGVGAGRLHGAVDELRVWKVARSESEIAAGMYKTLKAAGGLVARWALDEGATEAVDSVGTLNGTLHGGATFSKPGAALDRGLPPGIIAAEPANDAALTSSKADLSLTLTDPEDKSFEVTFYLRELTTADDFSMVVMPDTQYYTRSGDDPDLFYGQTKWIMANRDSHNILGAIHNGDIVDNATVLSQWAIADKAMAFLEEPLTGLPDGLPFGVAVGNHEQNPNSSYGGTEERNKHFGIDRFKNRAYYGGHYGSNNDESWYTFSAGGLDFVVVSFSYNTDPDAAILNWAKSIFQQYPGAFGIVNAHYIIGSGAGFGSQGKAIYDALKGLPNVQIFTNGHVSGEARRTDTYNGNVIHTMLADYQSRDNGGDGWMRIWEFSPANNELTVRTYSPALDKYETDDNSEFTLPIDLRGSGGPFNAVATVAPATEIVTTSLPGIKPGRTYEWYATVSDCVHQVTSPLRRFTTAP